MKVVEEQYITVYITIYAYFSACIGIFRQKSTHFDCNQYRLINVLRHYASYFGHFGKIRQISVFFGKFRQISVFFGNTYQNKNEIRGWVFEIREEKIKILEKIGVGV